MKFINCVIDMDCLVYRCGFSVEKYDKETDTLTVEPLKHALYNLNHMMKKVLEVTQCENYYTYITASGRSNFRFDIFPDYKANRKDVRKPFHYAAIREHCVRRWKAEVVEGQEADDACSIKHCELVSSLGFTTLLFTNPPKGTSIVCSIDKDFNNIPGWHYNYVKDEAYYVSEIEALRNFYLQILTGDTSDGIPRIKKGWRQKEAEEKISKATTEEELENIVLREIKLNTNEQEVNTTDEYVKRARLVWLRRKESEIWQPVYKRGNNV